MVYGWYVDPKCIRRRTHSTVCDFEQQQQQQQQREQGFPQKSAKGGSIFGTRQNYMRSEVNVFPYDAMQISKG